MSQKLKFDKKDPINPPGVRIDLKSWERGRIDALEGIREPSEPVQCSWSWSSGWIEGDAERQSLSTQPRG